MNYSENMGLSPLTREQRLTVLYNALFNSGLISMTLTEFKGTNIHRFFSESTLPQLEQIQEEQLKAIASLFTFWQEQNLAIRGSFGCSYEGWANNFEGLCAGLNIVDSGRAQNDTHIKNTPLSSQIKVPGEVAFFFDELKLDDEDSLEAIHAAFKRSIWPGMMTPEIEGSEEITIDFTSTGAKTYRFFNLQKEDYTPLKCQIRVAYKENSVQYEPALITKAFVEQFNAFNAIGKHFHPRAFLNTNEFPNLSTITVWYEATINGTTSWQSTVFPCNPRQKFALEGNPEVVLL